MGFAAAATTNIIAMIGAGPFLTIPLLLQAMHGPQAMLGWLVGAVVAIADGLVWAELGAAMPRSGGGYQYLLEAYGPNGAGRSDELPLSLVHGDDDAAAHGVGGRRVRALRRVFVSGE